MQPNRFWQRSLTPLMLMVMLLLAACGRSSATPTPTGVVPERTATPQPADAPTTTAAGAELDLTNTTWQWIEFQDTAGMNNISVPNPENYLITFLPDGQLALRADCNRGTGTYTVDNRSLTVIVGALTRAACPIESLDQTFITRLGEVVTFVPDGENLVLNLMADAGNLVFAPGTDEQLAAEPAATAKPAATTTAEPEAPSPVATLAGTTWRWLEFQDSASGAEANNISVPNPANYTISFLPDGQLGIRADCNVGSGTYTLDGSSLTIQLGLTTLVACPDDSLDQEFRTRLEQVATFVQDGDNLVLNLALDSGNMIFAPFNELVGTTWQWLEFQDSASGAEANNISVPNPANYTISFLPDGQLGIRADCNVGSGTYTLDGSSLTIQLGLTTLVACPDDSLDQEFRTRLEQVATFVQDGDNLVLNLALDSGNMVFQPE